MNDGQCSGPDVLSENRGIKNLEMVCVSKQIWELPLRKKVTVTAEYLPCALNKHADIESRRKKTLLNGSKTPQCSKDCVKKRKPLIDLFASRVFHQLPTYVAWRSIHCSNICILNNLEQGVLLCIPSFLTNNAASEQDREGQDKKKIN